MMKVWSGMWHYVLTFQRKVLTPSYCSLLLAVSCFCYSLMRQMEVVWSSKTLVNFYWTTRCHIPEVLSEPFTWFQWNFVWTYSKVCKLIEFWAPQIVRIATTHYTAMNVLCCNTLWTFPNMQWAEFSFKSDAWLLIPVVELSFYIG
jgi:hypothetical protein